MLRVSSGKAEVFWTHGMSRRVSQGTQKSAAINRARKEINREMSSFCRAKGVRVISHKDIVFESPSLFCHDRVHLSELGNNLYLGGLPRALEE